jgi:multidrug resistance protein
MRKRSPDSSLPDDGFKAILRPILLLALTVFIDLLGFGIILPNLPQYIEHAVGGDHAQAAWVGSWLAASYSLSQFICAPAWGRYSDRAGRRPVILLSLIGIAISYVLFGLSNGHLWMLFAARLAAGFLSSASIGVSFAYVADVTTPQNRAKGMGILGACFGLGFMFGPALGGWLGQISLSLPAYVAAGLALLNFVASSFLLPESLTQAERTQLSAQEKVPFLRLLTQVMSGSAGRLFGISFLLTFGFAAMEQVFGFFLLARGIATPANQPQRMGTILAVVGLVGIIVQGGLLGRMVKRFGEGPVAQLGLAILTIGYIVLLIPREYGLMIFLTTLPLSAGRSFAGTSISALISRKANLGQGLTLSVSQSLDALARTVGPLTAGWLFRTFGPTMPYQFAAILTVVALVVTFLVPSILALPKAEAETASL